MVASHGSAGVERRTGSKISRCLHQRIDRGDARTSRFASPRPLHRSASRTQEAESKPRQLRLAQRAGLTVPATLITNDAARAKEFFKQYRGAVVTKLIRHPPESLARAGQSMHTSQVNASDLEDSNAFRHCLALFQERIEKGRDLRAIFVNGHFFVGAIDPGGLFGNSARLAPRRPFSVPVEEKDELPDRVSRQLTALMGDLGLPIAKAIADVLLGEHRRPLR